MPAVVAAAHTPGEQPVPACNQKDKAAALTGARAAQRGRTSAEVESVLFHIQLETEALSIY